MLYKRALVQNFSKFACYSCFIVVIAAYKISVLCRENRYSYVTYLSMIFVFFYLFCGATLVNLRMTDVGCKLTLRITEFLTFFLVYILEVNVSFGDIFIVWIEMAETLQLKGTLLGHNGWVTQIATNPKYPDMILSSSRGEFLQFMLDFIVMTCFWNLYNRRQFPTSSVVVGNF